MSDLLAIVGPDEDEARLLEEIVSWRPRRVTLLVADRNGDWAHDDSDAGLEIRDRIARLLLAIELRTGAAVVGLAGDRGQLSGWRFDHIVGEPLPLAA
jgi:hypothetical protein